MKVLVACEFSGIVREAFIRRGHDAWSCDLLPTEQEGNHIQGDVLDHLNDGWDLMIAHPPCTYLTKMAGRWWKRNKEEQEDALVFVLLLMSAEIERIAIENPVGKINSAIRKPDQIIHPYYFGDPWLKETCLWLKNLPPLFATRIVEPVGNWVRPGNIRNRRFNRVLEGGRGNSYDRSRFFKGIAQTMAEQWG